MPKKKKSAAAGSHAPHSALRTPHSKYPAAPAEQINPLEGLMLREDVNGESRIENGEIETPPAPSSILHPPSSPIAPYFTAPGVWLYHGNCLAVLDAVIAKYPEGRFDCIFADPPYFLSNGGITCHAGKMVKVHKGDWDKSRGPEWNHEFNTEWLRRCQRALKPNGTIWVSGTHHVIFSIGFAMQQLGYKILNDIAWEKPNPPPNLSCRYFTHSTETILWAAKNEKSKHLFNYQAMRAVTGKQMKTVWRDLECGGTTPLSSARHVAPEQSADVSAHSKAGASPDSALSPIWTMTAPGNDEKQHGKHPTQKPIALIQRCLLASTNPGDLVLDPFMGGGTTAIAALQLNRLCVGIELDEAHAKLAMIRADRETVLIWLRDFRVRIEVSVIGGASVLASREWAQKPGSSVASPHQQKNDLDLFSNLIDRSDPMADDAPKTDCIFHETKFVFLSCAVVSAASVVHTTVDVSLQEAWAKTPNGKKRETTHVVKCETEIFRVAKT